VSEHEDEFDRNPEIQEAEFDRIEREIEKRMGIPLTDDELASLEEVKLLRFQRHVFETGCQTAMAERDQLRLCVAALVDALKYVSGYLESARKRFGDDEGLYAREAVSVVLSSLASVGEGKAPTEREAISVKIVEKCFRCFGTGKGWFEQSEQRCQACDGKGWTKEFEEP